MSEILECAGRYLARREHSIGELRLKLAAKQFDGDEIDVAIERLVAEGLVDDRRFANAFVRSRASRLQGPRKIRAELKRRNIAEAVISEAFEEADLSWSDIAARWLARQGAWLDDYNSRAKYYRRLVNRGFSHDQAMDALSGRETPGDS